jgi:hypothetical protein
MSTPIPDSRNGSLDDLGNLLPLVVALVRQQLEGEGLAVLLEQPLAVALPASARAGSAFGIVRNPLTSGLFAQNPAERPVASSAEAQHHALEQVGLVDGVRKGQAHAAIGEARILQIEAEVGVARPE